MASTIRFVGITPKEINVKEMRLQLLNGLDLIRTQMLASFERVTQTWEHEVEFTPIKTLSGISLAGGIPTVGFETDDEIFTIVNEGARPHPIFPNGDYPLFFHSEYAAKTAPGVIDSWEGGPGEKDTFADGVSHPGFPARKFDQQIKEEMEPYFHATMQEAMRKAAKASGWS